MKYSQIKAILFDHDGTLVDSEQIHHKLWMQAADLNINELTDEIFATRLVGIPTEGNAEFLIKQFALNETVASLVAKKAEVTKAFLAQSYFPEVSGAQRVMSALQQQGLRMAIVSGSERYAVERSVAGNHFSEFIEFITTGAEVPNNKPAPDVYVRAMEKMGLSAADCIAVEDTEHGLEAAWQAGIPCVVIPNEHTGHHNFSKAVTTLSCLQSFLTYFSENR